MKYGVKSKVFEFENKLDRGGVGHESKIAGKTVLKYRMNWVTFGLLTAGTLLFNHLLTEKLTKELERDIR